MRSGIRAHLVGATSTLAALLYTGATAAHAEVQEASARSSAPAYRFDIPAGPLGQALRACSRAAGEQIIFSEESVRGRTSAPLKGVYTIDQAVDQLLQGSALKAVRTSSGVIAITESRADAEVPAAEPSEIVVVGTRIRNAVPTSPVITIGRAEIKAGGYNSVADVLAKTPQNYAGQTAATAGLTGGNTGFSDQVDIRGLGSEATLTLVNGRRLTAGAGDDGRAVDVSMIPLAAIERVDILTDGASALYGSDAIGGVVNVVLRKDFEGAETTAEYGLSEQGADRFRMSQVLGSRWESGRVLATFQADGNDALTYADLGVTSLDLRPSGGGDYRAMPFGSPGTVLPLGFQQGAPFASYTGPNGEPVFSALLPNTDGRALQLSSLLINESASADLVPRDALPKRRNYAGYLNVEQDIGPVTVFADGVYSDRKVDFATFDFVSLLFVPATNAFSPFNEDVLVGYQFRELGPVAFANHKKGYFANLGVRGSLGENWTWDIVGTTSADKTETDFSVVDMAELNMRLASSDPAVALNPFGNGTGQNPAAIEALRQRVTFHGKTNYWGAAASAQGALLDLPGGSVRVAVGAEHRDEELQGGVRRENGPADNYYTSPDRNIDAIYGELYIPIFGNGNARPGFQTLALSLAGRHESYSDFGKTTNPKVGLLWRPTRSLALKGNWGTSFRAPSLRELNFVNSVSQGIPVFDAAAPGGARVVFVDVPQGGNPSLREETAESYTWAVEYRPEWLEGAMLSATYYHIDYKNRIRGSLDGLDLLTLLQYEASLPPGIVVRSPTGELLQVSSTNINSARTVTSGYDFAAQYQWRAGSLGSLSLGATATYADRFDDQLVSGAPVLDLRGRIGNAPKWRGRLNASWTLEPWSASFSVSHIDGFRNESPDPRIVRRSIGSQTTVDAQLGFTPTGTTGLVRGLDVRVGVENLFNSRPPFVDDPQRPGFDPQNAVLRGRTFYLRLTKSFGAEAQ